MMSFRDDRITSVSVPMHILRLVGRINEYKGMQQLYHQQAPQVLESLRRIAAMQSIESSNRLDGVEIAPGKLDALLTGRLAPQIRAEAEIAGYRDTLAAVHGSCPYIPLTPNAILQLRRDLCRFAAPECGGWKSVDDTPDDAMPGGPNGRSVSALEIPHAMEELCSSFTAYDSAGDVEPLLLDATFVLDFLCIHPFCDGNGRMSRLLMLLLLCWHGYQVGRYVSIERIIEESKSSYYDALGRSSDGWLQGTHTLLPWWEYYLGVILAAYVEFENRVESVETGRGVKSAIVRSTVAETTGNFSISELMRLCPSVSRDMVRTVLERMREEGLVECLGSGRSAVWRKTVQH